MFSVDQLAFAFENLLFSNVFLLFLITEIAAVQLLQAWLALAQWQGQKILVKPWALKKETALLAALHSRFLRISEIFLRFSQSSLDYIAFPQFA